MTISSTAEELCAAVLEHSRQCAEDPSDAARVVQLAERIRSLALAYGEAVHAEAGWGNPLLAISAESTDEDVPLEVSNETEPNDRRWISVVENNALLVNDPDSVVRLARERTGRDLESLEEAVLALCAEDGWKPHQYPGNIIELDWRSTDTCTG
ncbi:hypothetical protein [Streptomyces sp. TLI_171]|uniref:hypothetical protein n=1 Tax=Streptomyces sp. TLI_171 TaxID=1938859 RepID=UPI000C192FD5|nr:hypothetical protein [Streptomyces sp. TLI_171]RKE23483.1 hypothetical protein BX266_6955 [Streptomyces sp. TLI_171]